MAGGSCIEQRLGSLLADPSRLRSWTPVQGRPVVEVAVMHPGHVVTEHEVDPSAVGLDDRQALALAATPAGAPLLERLSGLAESVAGQDRTGASDAVLLEGAAAAGRLMAQAAALQLRFSAALEARRRAEAEEVATRAPGSRPWDSEVRVFTAEELAARLHTSVSEARVLVARATALADPAGAGGAGAGVLAALQVGALDVARAHQLGDALAALPAAAADAVAARVLPGAGLVTRRSLVQRLARALIAVDPTAAAERARTRRAERSARWWVEPDGQACLQLRGPAEAIATVWSALDARARAARATARDVEREAAAEKGRPVDRTAAGALDAHRFDAAVTVARDVLEGACGPVARTAASRPVVLVTVPASVLLGLDQRSAWLEGYGPLDAETTRRIAADATWRRILTDPATGVAVGVDERTYTPSVLLQRLVTARHRTCSVPGCGAPAWRCEADHRIPWPDGPTGATNLQPLCKRHHLMKHSIPAPGDTGWTSHALPPPARAGRDPGGGGARGPDGGSDGWVEGAAVWTTPTGHTHRVDPDVLDVLDVLDEPWPPDDGR